jgi:hypothetical protein
MKTRTLADLYVRGREVKLDDGNGPPVVVWVQKLNPIENEKALRRANAYRATIFTQARDQESEMFLSALSEVSRLTRDEILDQLSMLEVGVQQPAIEAEIEAEEEWSKDGYLQGLYDAWNDGLAEKYAEDPEDPEALRVFNAMQVFAKQVEKQVEKQIAFMRDELDTQETEKLRKKLGEATLLSRVDLQWMAEFRRCQVWLSVRDPKNHRAYYFDGRAEVDVLEQDTLLDLIRAYSEIEVDGVEGKGSAGTPVSSTSSEPPVPEETEGSSGPAA